MMRKSKKYAFGGTSQRLIPEIRSSATLAEAKAAWLLTWTAGAVFATIYPRYRISNAASCLKAIRIPLFSLADQ
jgi:hypothetical protein